MIEVYEDLGQIMGEIEAAEMELETMITNGKCSTANRYLQEAVAEIKHALSDMSDALFEITTTSCQDDVRYNKEVRVHDGFKN